MLKEIKLLANKRDVPYQSLMKIFLSERIEKELSELVVDTTDYFLDNLK